MTDFTPQFWLSALQLAGNVGLGVYVWFVNRDKARKAEITALSTAFQAIQDEQAKKCASHLTRTTTVETRLEAAPTRGEIGEIHDRVTAVKGGVDELTGLIKGLRDNVTLLVDHHLRGGKK